MPYSVRSHVAVRASVAPFTNTDVPSAHVTIRRNAVVYPPVTGRQARRRCRRQRATRSARVCACKVETAIAYAPLCAEPPTIYTPTLGGPSQRRDCDQGIVSGQSQLTISKLIV